MKFRKMKTFKTKDGSMAIACEANADEFQLLVREVERLREEAANQKTFQQQLEHYTKIAFDNEDGFKQGFAGYNEAKILDISFSSSSIFLTVKYGGEGIFNYTETLTNFIEWADNLEGEK